jgi:hypothetical protein
MISTVSYDSTQLHLHSYSTDGVPTGSSLLLSVCWSFCLLTLFAMANKTIDWLVAKSEVPKLLYIRPQGPLVKT